MIPRRFPQPVTAIGLILAGLSILPAQTPTPPDTAAIARGTKDFVTNCAFCHGSSGTGGESGPDLLRSVLVLHDQKGDQIGPVIRNGRAQKGMPKFALTQEQIEGIAAFLHAQAEARADRDSYQIQNIVTGDPKAGEAYFNGAGKCVTCHSAGGDLKGVAGRFDPVALQSRFLYPKTFYWPGMPQTGKKPPPVTLTVTLPSGETFSGELRHMDDFSVALADSGGEYHSWLRARTPGMKVEVHNPLQAHIDLLPQYTDTDMHNVLAYLETLK